LRTVFTSEAGALAQSTGSVENVSRIDLIEQPLEFAISQFDAIERLKLLTEVVFKRRPVADVRAVFVLQSTKLLDELLFKLTSCGRHGDL